MPLKITNEHVMTCNVLHNEAVISHLRGVLNTYVNKPDFNLFYIGITSNLEARRLDHQANKPRFRLMCPIYEESNPKSDMAFHNLERDAINALRNGMGNPDDASKLMKCGNGPSGSLPKNWLYLLLG